MLQVEKVFFIASNASTCLSSARVCYFVRGFLQQFFPIAHELPCKALLLNRNLEVLRLRFSPPSIGEHLRCLQLTTQVGNETKFLAAVAVDRFGVPGTNPIL